MDQLHDVMINLWPRALSSLIIILAAWLLYKALLRGMEIVGRRGRVTPGTIIILTRVLRGTVIFVALIILLQTWQVVENVMTVLTGMLALVAVGFVAVWSVLSNILCSAILLLTRPFRIGDYIESPSDNIGGIVRDINMFQTTLSTEDGGYVQIPNNMIFQRILKRYPEGKPVPKEESPEPEK